MDEQESALERLRANRDFPVVEALVAYVRVQRRSITAGELATVVNRPKRQVYGLVKLARIYLAATTGECMPNIRSVGYRISTMPRAFLWESAKAGNRADGHLGQEINLFRRVSRDSLTTPDDVELYLTQEARTCAGEMRLKLSGKAKSILQRREKNLALAARAEDEAMTPWAELGLEDPAGDRN